MNIIVIARAILMILSIYVVITSTTTFLPPDCKHLEWPVIITWVVTLITVNIIRCWKKVFPLIFPTPTHRTFVPSIAAKRISVILDLRTENRVGAQTLYRKTVPKWTTTIVPSSVREMLTNIAEELQRLQYFA